jgi:hypothetical protein
VQRGQAFGRIAGGSRVDARHDDALVVVAYVHANELLERSGEQRGHTQQEHRERQLSDDQQSAERKPRAVERHDAAAVRVQRLCRIHARGTQRRQKAESDGGQRRHGRRKQQHAIIERKFHGDGARRAGDDSQEHIAAPPRQDDTTKASRRANQQALREQLAQNPQPTRPNRHANGQLAPSRGGTRQQQAREVRARDHQQQRHHREEGHERRPRLLSQARQAPAAGLERHALRLHPSPRVGISSI